MDIKPIRTKADYKAALKAVESLMGAKGRTPQGDRLDVLVTLIEGYERQPALYTKDIRGETMARAYAHVYDHYYSPGRNAYGSA